MFFWSTIPDVLKHFFHSKKQIERSAGINFAYPVAEASHCPSTEDKQCLTPTLYAYKTIVCKCGH